MKKAKKYSHLKKAERLEISILLKRKYSLGDIAEALHRNPGTISREIKNNSVEGIYDPRKANHKAYVKRKYSKYQGMKIEENSDLRKYIERHLKKDWSPEEIAGRLKEVDKHIAYASRGAIYKFIYSVYGRSLEQYLRYRGKKRKRKGVSATKIDGRIFIDKRPKIVENKRRFGDWEGDFIVSGKNGKGILVVLHERKARYALVRKLVHPTIELVHRFIFEMTGGYIVNTLTLDNDIIFRKHKELSLLLDVPIYFCHPYHSWEKGGIENTNKLIRQYVKKGSDISQYSDEYIQMVQDKLNNRPRKCLHYKTPLEVMEDNNQIKFEIHGMIKLFTLNLLKQKSPSVALEG